MELRKVLMSGSQNKLNLKHMETILQSRHITRLVSFYEAIRTEQLPVTLKVCHSNTEGMFIKVFDIKEESVILYWEFDGPIDIFIKTLKQLI